MKKIVVLGIDLSDEHKRRLEAIGELEIFESPTSSEDLVSKTKNADEVYSNGNYLLESLPKLKNVFVTYPYVELGVFNSEELEKNNVYISNARGGNRNSVAEWATYMILSLFRKFGPFVRTTQNIPFELNESLENKKVLIIGHGNIGSRVGELCQNFAMKVEYFDRDDNLLEKSKDKDIIVNALNCNSSSKNLLGEKFFMNLKKGSYFVSFARRYTYDLDGLIKTINANIVACAAIDCDPESFGDTSNDFYQTAMECPKILVTPHIAFSTTLASKNGREIAIQNIEAFASGKPINLVEKE